MQKITEFVTATQAAFAQINTALDNIAADEVNLAKMIQDLKDQLAASQTALSPADQLALDTVLATATSMAARSQAIAEAVPDLPAPPTV